MTEKEFIGNIRDSVKITLAAMIGGLSGIFWNTFYGIDVPYVNKISGLIVFLLILLVITFAILFGLDWFLRDKK